MFGKLAILIAGIAIGVFMASRCGIAAAAPPALDDPDILGLLAFNSYDNLAVSGDVLYLIQYQIEYSVLPLESVSQGWVGRLVDAGGSGQLCSVSPHAGDGIPSLGYSQGVFGCYFVEAPTITGVLRLHLSGNPGLSPTPAGSYSSSLTEKSGSELAPDLRAIAQGLESLWDIDLVAPSSDGIIRFTTSGQSYFESALPHLRQIAPDLFNLQSIRPDFPERNVDTAYETSRQSMLNGTPFDTGIDLAVQATGLSEVMVKFLGTLFFCGIAALMVWWYLPDSQITSALQLSAAFVVLMLGYWFGLVPMQALAALAVAGVLATATILFLHRSA